MAPLPPERSEVLTAFEHVSLDFFGPMITTHACDLDACPHDSRKAYGCIFTCFDTRAIHLELFEDGTNSTFLGALRRFVARRGVQRSILSDNAKIFNQNNRELRQLYKNLKKETTSKDPRVRTIE